MITTFLSNHFAYPSLVIASFFLSVIAFLGVISSFVFFFRHRSGRLDWDLKRILAAFLRVFVITLCLLAIARPHWKEKRVQAPWVVFLVDNSLSMEGTRSIVETYIRDRIDHLDSGQFAIMGFAESAFLFQPWQKKIREQRLIPWEDFVGRRDVTDIEGAITASLNLLPPDRKNGAVKPMIVLITDGNENRGSLLSAASRVREAQVYFEAVTLSREAKGEISVQRLIIPEGMRMGEPFSMALVAYNDNTAPVQATLTLERDGVMVGEGPVPITLFPGKNLIDRIPAFPQFERPGHYFYEASVTPLTPQDDFFDANNQSAQILRLDEVPELYIVEGSRGASHLLTAQAWGGRFSKMESQIGSTVPESVLALLPYDSIVLVDVPATQISQAAMQALRTYVQEFGGGLIVIGGQHSFEQGSYKGTILEELLPVEIGKPKKQDASTGIVIFLMDYSDSMSGIGLELAKLSALETVKNIPDGVHIEVIAFDSSPHLKLSPTELNSNTRGQVMDTISWLTSGSGTDLRPALKMALDDANAFIQNSPDAIGGRIFIFTDGQVSGSLYEYEQLLDQYGSQKIQVNCLGLGPEEGGDPLAQIAVRGRGKYKRFLDRSQKVPFFAFEDDFLRKRPKAYKPIWTGNEPMLKGFPIQQELPFSLKEYNQMTLKPEGHLSLYIQREKKQQDTLLAWRDNGLGRVAAFGCDASGMWSSGLVASEYYKKLFLHILTFIRRSELANCRIEAQQESNENIRLQMTTNELEEGHFLAKIFFSDSPNAPLKSRTLPLRPVRPGVFEGVWKAKDDVQPGGVYAALIKKVKHGVETLYAEATVYIKPPDTSEELAKVQPNFTLLEQAADRALGKLLSTDEGDLSFPSFEGESDRELIGPPYVYLFGSLLILLLLADIGIRAGKFHQITQLVQRRKRR